MNKFLKKTRSYEIATQKKNFNTGSPQVTFLKAVAQGLRLEDCQSCGEYENPSAYSFDKTSRKYSIARGSPDSPSERIACFLTSWFG